MDLFLLPRITCVHSSFLGLSSVVVLGFSPGEMVIAVIVVVVIDDIGLVVFESKFWRSAPAACNSSIGAFCPQQPPPSFGFRIRVCVVSIGTPSCLSTW